MRMCLQSRGYQQHLSGSAHLTIIGALKQLCNHPRLMYNKAALAEHSAQQIKRAQEEFEGNDGLSRDVQEESLAEV